MNRKLTSEQRQFIAQAHAEIERAIAKRKPRASKLWIARLASETGPMPSTESESSSMMLLSPTEADERMLAAAVQSLFASLAKTRDV
jgi:hypothetical protein